MKKSEHTSIGDFLALGETALSVLLGASKEMKAHLSDKRESVVRSLDLVTRDEFDAAFAMIKKMRQIQGDLDKRLTVLEKKMPVSSPQKQARKKTISKKN
ncbi:MAG: accessory factor UbiK family protein [Alphaproteobacteria bacterium]|nr:accessory factor UbiK family protein [Alphaproteobacteria bacterium]